MHFYLRKNIFNYKDINCFSLFNDGDIFYVIKIYSNNHQSALKYLKNTKFNFYNVLVMASDFNIKDKDWNSSYPFHLTHSNVLFDIMDSFDLRLSYPIYQVLTCYSDNTNDTNSVINLFFLHPNSIKFDNHIIISKLQYLSDYTLLTVNILL